jgi:hypothetical protein
LEREVVLADPDFDADFLPVDDFLEVEVLEDELPDLLEVAREELFFEAAFFEAVRDPDFEAVFLEAPPELRDEDLEDAFLGAAFFEAGRPDVFFELALLPEDDPDFLGTFAPFSLASERPIAIACLREVTFFPLRPLFSFPSCISCIVFSTFFPAPFEYLAI